MFGLIGLAVAGFVGLVVISVIFGIAALLFWLVLLPFRLLGFAFKLIGAVLFLPLFLLVGLVALACVGFPLLFLVVLPLLPIALIVLGIWWLAKRGPGHAPAQPRVP